MKLATSVVHVQNDRTQVTEWIFEPGAETGHHVHGHDYVIVPITSGTIRLVDSEGQRDVALQPGSSYFRRAGTSHNVFNLSPAELRFVEVELI
jgi:mannose-6-phosphate isomerase-like protein (cupin superfamily)